SGGGLRNGARLVDYHEEIAPVSHNEPPGEVSPPRRSLTGQGLAPALGLRAGTVGSFIPGADLFPKGAASCGSLPAWETGYEPIPVSALACTGPLINERPSGPDWRRWKTAGFPRRSASRSLRWPTPARAPCARRS